MRIESQVVQRAPPNSFFNEGGAVANSLASAEQLLQLQQSDNKMDQCVFHVLAVSRAGVATLFTLAVSNVRQLAS
jgi:hypothetical protein